MKSSKVVATIPVSGMTCAACSGRVQRSLEQSAGVQSANVNLPIGTRGRLSGTLNRNFQANRTVDYVQGVPESGPVGESDYWQGSLQLSWDM